jgi:prepilin-type processing-associated H-X9-DG protein
MRSRRRRGFTLRDMMVVILIIGLFLGVVVPAVDNAREAGRRAQCQNNMRQIGLGLLGFVNANNRFPNAGTIYDDPAVHGGDPTRSNLYLALTDPGALGRGPGPLLGSWAADIIPYLDNQYFPIFDSKKSYLDTTLNGASNSSNAAIAATANGILRCPDDTTAVPNAGNLSYAVNGGFSRWPAVPVSWDGSPLDGKANNGGVLTWLPPGVTWRATQGMGRKLGVMFLGTQTGDQPWDIANTPSDITDGSSTTLLVGENTLVGVSKGTRYSGGLPTNWACPLPNFCMFLASDDVCHSPRSTTDCLGGQLRPTKGTGAGWSFANRAGTFEAINDGRGLTIEGSFPFANGGHPGGSNFVFCDGATRFLSETIDGKVYAAIISPAGSTLPRAILQHSPSMNAYAE